MSGTTQDHRSGGRGNHGRHRPDCGDATWTPAPKRAGERPGRHARPDPWPPAGAGVTSGTLPAFPPPRASPAAWPPDPRPLVPAPPRHPEEDDDPTEPQALRPLPPDPLCPETGAGLSKFNLGTVPASVTPPKSWRGAALFTVAASAGVLVTLVFVSTSLTQPATDPARIDALPGVGSELPFTASGVTGSDGGYGRYPAAPAAPSSTTRPPSDGPTGTPETSTAVVDGQTRVIVVDGTTRRARPSPSAGTPTGASRPTVTTSYPPPETTVVSPQPHIVRQTAEPEPMINDTERYYQYAASDPEKSAQYTDGSLHREGKQGIEKRYPHARSIQVHQIKADPSARTTTNRITVHKDDGSTVTKTRTLKFSPGKHPKIVADKPGKGR